MVGISTREMATSLAALKVDHALTTTLTNPEIGKDDVDIHLSRSVKTGHWVN